MSGELQSWGLRGKRCMAIEKNQLWTSAGRGPCHLFLSADSQSHSKVWFSPQPRPIETVGLTVSQVTEWKVEGSMGSQCKCRWPDHYPRALGAGLPLTNQLQTAPCSMKFWGYLSHTTSSVCACVGRGKTMLISVDP